MENGPRKAGCVDVGVVLLLYLIDTNEEACFPGDDVPYGDTRVERKFCVREISCSGSLVDL